MNASRARTYTMVARAGRKGATRERIVRAMADLALEHAYEDITLAQIARAANVSHQTVLNHFDSKEGVAVAAADVIARETGAARAKARPGDLRHSIRVLVQEYERIGDANARWATTAERLGSLAPRLNEARAAHQAWLQQIFADALPRRAIARRRTVHALHAATDVYTWKLLRRDLHVSRRDTEAIIVDLVRGVLRRNSVQQRRRP